MQSSFLNLFAEIVQSPGEYGYGSTTGGHALAIASALLVLEAWLLSRFVSNILAYSRGIAGRGWRVRRCAPCGLTFKPVTPRSLSERVRYFTLRFAPHAPQWQLAIWLRQLCLFAIRLVIEMVSPDVASPSDDFAFRYSMVGVAITALLAFWALQRRTQPYVYRFQNAVEEWLYASNVLVLGLACVYRALAGVGTATVMGEAGSGGVGVEGGAAPPPPPPDGVRYAIEIVLLLVLVGTFAGAAVVVICNTQRTRRTLATLDLSHVLEMADQKLDGPIHERLLDGTIRLLRCDWLLSDGADAALGRSAIAPDGAPIILRRQEMPDEAYFSPQEAAAIFRRGDRSVLTLSYGWQTGPHPDPSGAVLRMVRDYLSSDPTTRGCALFWDVASRPQPPMTEEEQVIGDKALAMMSSFYASIGGTCVIQQKEVPPRPAQYDGWCMLFGIAEELRTKSALVADLAQFGTVTECEILPALIRRPSAPARATSMSSIHSFLRRAVGVERETSRGESDGSFPIFRMHTKRPPPPLQPPSEGAGQPSSPHGESFREGASKDLVLSAHARVRFAHHSEAEAAVAGLRQLRRGAAPLYNATPYEGVGGRGWCIVEKGASSVVAAHLSKAKTLSERFVKAEASRPKLINITGGEAEAVVVKPEPEAVLKATMGELRKARFTFPSDCDLAHELMADFEWTIKTAMDQAKLALQAHVLTVDPRVVRETKRHSSKEPAAGRATALADTTASLQAAVAAASAKAAVDEAVPGRDRVLDRV